MRISVAIPASSLSDESLKSAKTRKASVIARACAIFGVDTIYVYDEGKHTQDRSGRHRNSSRRQRPNSRQGNSPAPALVSDLRRDTDLLIMALRYVETPQFLRRRLFPHLNDLKFAGMMLPLRIPSHTVTKHPEKGQVREGVVIPAKGERFIDIGSEKLLRYTGRAEPGKRVTIIIKNTSPDISYAEIDKSDARQYWGYHVRHRASLPSLLSEWRNAKGQTIITSRRGKTATGVNRGSKKQPIPSGNHTDEHHGSRGACEGSGMRAIGSRILRDMSSDMLVVFGSPERGVHEILGGNVSSVSDARVLNFFPEQQTATVRLEEAITGTLAVINAEIHAYGR